jgi:hypothetical protein
MFYHSAIRIKLKVRSGLPCLLSGRIANGRLLGLPETAALANLNHYQG